MLSLVSLGAFQYCDISVAEHVCIRLSCPGQDVAFETCDGCP